MDQGHIHIIHLYADGSLIFCEPEKEQMLHSRMVLLFFKALSDLHINLANIVIYPVYEVSNILKVVDIMGCSV